MICTVCGQKLAQSLQGRENHMKLYHHVKEKYRPKAEVVAQVEARLCCYIIDTKVCLPGCKCNRCFQAALDELVKKTEANAHASRTHFGFDDEL